MPTPPITLGAVNLEARDPTLLSRFWAAVIGAETPQPGKTVYLPSPGPGGFAMFFQPLGDTVPGRQTIHLDLTVPWGSRRSEVERIIGLGATHRWDVLDEVPHVQWTTLADPEGNLFCVAEHPPASD
ncbi:MAG: VOC family protein [Aeromicrobium sp.]